MQKKFDVVVIGGGTSGCACAYTSAKLGLKTLLIEKSAQLGGAMTSSLVIPVMKSGENQINTEFYSDLIAELKSINGQITYQDNKGWFNPELLKIALDTLLTRVGVEISFYTDIVDVYTENSHINRINIASNLSVYNDKIHGNNLYLKNSRLSADIEARYFIDATGFANFSKILNCEFIDDDKKSQPVTLRFIMGGIDLSKFSDWLLNVDSDREVTTVNHIDNQIHLSTAYTWDTNKNWALAPYFDDAVSKNILKDSDRNYFQIFTVAGAQNAIAFNCPRIIENVSIESTSTLSNALIEARQAILRLSNFCKIYFPGFENAYISNIANDIGIRVSERPKGKYIYKSFDIKNSTKFDNPALISNYPIDIHSTNKNSSTLEHIGEYQLPIESLMSNDYENLFIIGRALSAEFEAQGALRVQASCFSMGEAVARYINKGD